MYSDNSESFLCGFLLVQHVGNLNVQSLFDDNYDHVFIIKGQWTGSVPRVDWLGGLKLE
jgi:hypothetical protein